MKKKNLKFIVCTVACSVVIICTIVGVNANNSTVGDVTLEELIRTPDANAKCETYGPENKGRCGISDNCFWNDSYSDCNPWAPNT